MKKAIIIACSLSLLLAVFCTTCGAYTIATDANGDGMYNRHFQPYSVSYITYTSQYEEYSTFVLNLSTDLVTNRPTNIREQGFKFYNYLDNVNPRTEVTPAPGNSTTDRVIVRLTSPLSLSLPLPNNLADITQVLEYGGGVNSASGGLGFFSNFSGTDYVPHAVLRYAVTDASQNTIEYTATTDEHTGLYNPYDLIVADYTLDTLNLANITILDYYLDIQGYYWGADRFFLDFELVDNSDNHWLPIDSNDISGSPTTIFDGDVGVADLLLKPLEALISFELFPNFSLGSVFGILAGISLFTIILKVFAGG